MSRLVVQGAVRWFGALAAVDKVDLVVEEGEICGLVGPNGSGKTTLLNIISGVLPMSDGNARLGDVDISRMPAHAVSRQGLSRTFQLVRLVKHATAIENVLCGLYSAAPDRHVHRALFPIGLRRERRALEARARDALDRAGLSEHAQAVVDELPFGLQRRVEIARAVVSEPRVLLLDEPAAGITEGDIRELGRLMVEQASRGCSIVLVDHHLKFVLDVCPRLVVMNFGRKLFDGTSTAAIEDKQVQEAYVGV
jgi:ABC-type branched-subunit amino acid transport system ATPase component